MPSSDRPQWQLPPGVSRGTWDYVHSTSIAEDYDDFFEFNRLFELDEAILRDSFPRHENEAQWIADLGCGTGRALIPLVRRGFRGLAVDLSREMLEIVADKACVDDLDIDCLHANLVQLECIESQSIDYSICLFSTMGMIRGSQNRLTALKHVRRILKPDGVFVIHVHNYWYNLYDPGGPWWLLRNLFASIFDEETERGDKYFPYRGVANMFLHVFTRHELKRSLKRAGFQKFEFLSLDPRRGGGLRFPWLFGRLRANGWIVVCR